MSSKAYPCIRCATLTVLTCDGLNCDRALCDLCREDDTLCSTCAGSSEQHLSIATYVLTMAQLAEDGWRYGQG